VSPPLAVGFVIAAKALLDRNSNPSETEAHYWLAGNLCRCTGYDKVIRAVLDAACRGSAINRKIMAAAGPEV
jgi:aerobic-type carbon monoxide dehydrogenase small subunit (CoxS/CutS family)